MAIQISSFGCARIPHADLIISGGRIHTMNPKNPIAEAVAIQGDRIVYVGSGEGARKYEDEITIVINLDGKTAYPGFVDAHAHLMSLGKSLAELNFVGTGSSEEIRKMVLEKQQAVPKGSWIRGRGWDQNDWPVEEFPTWRDLSGTEENLVYLRRVDGHAAWVNKTVLDHYGITRETEDPPGGRIIRDENGDPTGVFIDDAKDLITAHIPEPTIDEKTAWAKAAILECNRYGMVGMHDAGIHKTDLQVYENLHGSGQLSLRIYAMADGDSIDFVKERFALGPSAPVGGYVSLRAVKLYADGALGSRGAAMLEPYSDDPRNTGLILTAPDSLYEMSRLALDAGFQVCTHAIGDAGNRVILDAYERALKEHRSGDHRLRVEHAQVVSLEDIPRSAQLGIIPVMQPTHATSDMYWAEDRLGPERIKGAYAWRKFLDSGCKIPCGSDFPVEGVNPLWGIYAAVTRQDHDGWPEGGWYPGERMTIEEAVRGFTIDAAFAAFAEKETGSIEVGKLADLTVLDKDLFEISPKEILNARVIYTIVGGSVVYSAP
ncbi:MAG: amidohydrolase family protein [Candidatus Latescibacteria bacterium]|nr:amidohydrolase family protein [Candidatus Latescibacterota bacterium]NIO56736.1 amidohydrolase family protein [Candidatus Latescibacterota bacterium]NIT02321.1 amidohydrolase family protein [Candidatus Latescibacterota bacterium]NIT39204.1 amidohydrolase family protein [Candidatus Latescibacterota bacterium]